MLPTPPLRILLVMPTPFENGRLGLENVIWLSEPVGLTAVAAAVPREHEIRILDLRLEDEDSLAETLRSFRPHLVGTTSMTTDAYQAKAILRVARAICPDALTVIGGHHPTLCPGEFETPDIDVIVQGEGEHTFRELVERWREQHARGERSFTGVRGARFRTASGHYHVNPKREQTADLDTLAPPRRDLVRKYRGRYFFTGVRPMASIFTSRGCSFDCNFCAIWEFYERRTRFLSATRIVDQMEACDEPFVFLLDDNFLTSPKRAQALCDELERRNVKKYWLTQGRTDFAADHPELMARLAKNGLVMVLSGYESNDDDNLAALRKKNSWQKNLRANEVMRDNGIFVTGIFMARADWTRGQFEDLYEYVRGIAVAIPLLTILTPLPGTELYRVYQEKLLTTDHRLFDLLHAVLPTRLPRPEFYALMCRFYEETKSSVGWAMRTMVRRRPGFVSKILPGMVWFYARTFRYQRIHYDPASFLRDEEGLLDGPGARAGLNYRDVRYPTAAEPDAAREARSPELVTLRVKRARLWTDEVAEAAREAS